MSDIISFLKERRSVIVKNLQPTEIPQADIDAIIDCGLRVPDHGVLGPWHIKIITGDSRMKLGSDILRPEFARLHPDATDTMLDFEEKRFCRTNLIMAVISKAPPHAKIPQWEMHLSAGAVCQNVLTAALALGYGAQWVTEWYSYNTKMLEALGGEPTHDQIAGFIYIGQASEPPKPRRRPEREDVVSILNMETT